MVEQPDQNVFQGPDKNRSFDFVSVVDRIYSHRWLVICSFLFFIGAGAIYAVISSPVYQAKIVLQLEETGDSQSRSSNEYVGDVSSIIGVKSNADGEVQILGSALVIGDAVDALNLTITTRPVYFPIIGRAVARDSRSLSTPGLFGLGGFAWGSESIDVPTFDVPKRNEGSQYRLTALSGNRFELLGPGMNAPASGTIGVMQTFATADGPVRLLVSRMAAQPRVEFALQRASRQATIDNLRRALQVEEQGTKSDVLSATMTGLDPIRLTATLNAIGQAYVRQNAARKAVRAQASLAFLSGQLPAMRQQVEQAEVQYNAYRNTHASIDINEQARLLLRQSSEAETVLYQLEQKYQEVSKRFTGNHPDVLQISKQMEATRQYRNSITNRIRQLPVEEQGAVRLMREVRVATDLYATLRSNMEQLQLVRAGKISTVRVVDNAEVPEVPIKPRKLLIIGAAAVGGILAGLGLAFARNSLAQGVVDPSELSSIGLPMYGTIPVSDNQERLEKVAKDHDAKERLLAVRFPQDPAIEGMRVLRTALQVRMLGAPNNVVMLSGPMPQSGKSFTSANLAAVLAAGGKRVLLVDADLRRGTIHRSLGLQEGPGLADVMDGPISIDEAICRQVLPRLDFLGVGRYPANASELLLRGDFQRRIKRVADRYDIVVLDAPAALAVSDVGIIAPSAGTILLMARYGVTRASEMNAAVERLNQAGCKVNGLVLNGIPDGAGGYAYAMRHGTHAYKAYYQGAKL